MTPLDLAERGGRGTDGLSGRVAALSPSLWEGSSVHTECTLHQLAPYIGKMKSTMAGALIDLFTSPGDTVLDPFVGSGTVGLECLLRGRNFVGADVNPYSLVLTGAKLTPPSSLEEALAHAEEHIEAGLDLAGRLDLTAPKWVRAFFHPRPLREVQGVVEHLTREGEHFLLACLLGVLHHQRPGFLSYPSSHLVPYLRTMKFPRDEYPEMYEYRDVRTRLLAKVKRAYRRPAKFAPEVEGRFVDSSAADLRLPNGSVDAVVTSPPYMNALDYARDNRLRMWFLGVRRFRHYDKKLNTRDRFVDLMTESLRSIADALRPGGTCVLVVGEARRKRVRVPNGEIVSALATETVGAFELVGEVDDEIPDVRRARRGATCTKAETILVLRRTTGDVRPNVL